MVLVAPLSLVVAMIVAAALRERENSGLKFGLLGALVVSAVAGAGINAYAGGGELTVDYATRVRPALEWLRSRPETCVIVRDQEIAQELEAAMPAKVFFRPNDNRAFERLAAGLHRAGQSRVLVISVRQEDSAREFRFPPGGPLRGGRLAYRGPRGIYHAYVLEFVPG
jgi:hypothetical protein